MPSRLRKRVKPLVIPDDPSIPLVSSRHERFAQFCATGITPAKAYTSVGYAGKGAPQSACQLLKRPQVSARVKYLHEQSAKVQAEGLRSVTEELVLTKERVLRRLDHLSRAAEADKRYGAAIRAEQLLGVEVGMFVISMDHNVKWDGDLTKLDAGQLEKVKQFMEAKIYGDDQARLERDKAAYMAEWAAQHQNQEDVIQ